MWRRVNPNQWKIRFPSFARLRIRESTDKYDINPSYLKYVREKQRKNAEKGRPVADYAAYDPFGERKDDPKSDLSYSIISVLPQSDSRYGQFHPSEVELPTDDIGRRNVYGQFKGEPLQGAANWNRYYTEWPDVGTNLVPPGFGSISSPLVSSEMDFCRKYGFELTTCLGYGNYATVWKCNSSRLPKGPQQLACKVLDLQRFRPDVTTSLHEAVALMFREVDLLKILSHENVVKCEYVFNIHDSDTGFPFIRVLLFMELCEGDVRKLIDSHPNKKFSEDEAREVMVDVCKGVKYLHDNNVVHFDIKPSNILYITDSSTRKKYKLTDFGLSRQFKPRAKIERSGGTARYKAPELDRPGPSKPKKADIYSLGSTLIELLVGNDWVRARTNLNQSTGTHLWPIVLDKWQLSPGAADLIRRMTAENPSKRPNIKTIIRDKWLNNI